MCCLHYRHQDSPKISQSRFFLVSNFLLELYSFIGYLLWAWFHRNHSLNRHNVHSHVSVGYIRLHVGFCGLTQVSLPAEIWKTCNCIVLPLLWDLSEDVTHFVLYMCASAVREGTQHCYQVAVKVIWKIIYTNTLQGNSHPRTRSDLHLQRRRCAACCSLQGKLLEDKTLCSALKAIGLAACQWGISPQSGRCSLWATGAGPLSSTKERLSSPLCGLRWGHRVLWFLPCWMPYNLSWSGPYQRWTKKRHESYCFYRYFPHIEMFW